MATTVPSRGANVAQRLDLTFTSIIQIGAPFGALIAALIAERRDRTWGIALVAVVIAICCLLYGLTF